MYECQDCDAHIETRDELNEHELKTDHEVVSNPDYQG